MGGLNWFQAFCYGNAVLREIALRVHSAPTLASAAERDCSVFGFIHSKSRNRLYGHKVEKRVYIHQNMRSKNKLGTQPSKSRVFCLVIFLMKRKRRRSRSTKLYMVTISPAVPSKAS